jgi:hypothetical protein
MACLFPTALRALSCCDAHERYPPLQDRIWCLRRAESPLARGTRARCAHGKAMRAAVLLALGLLVPPGLRVTEAQECDASEPDLTGNNMVGALDLCDGTAADATCGHTCASGYEGGSVTCESSGDYTVTACTSIVCTRPSDVTGYTVADTNLDLGAGAFDVTAACAAGYEGTAAASACSTHGRDYTLSGCSGCSAPTVYSTSYGITTLTRQMT